MAQDVNAHMMGGTSNGNPNGPVAVRPTPLSLTPTTGEAGDNAGNNAQYWTPVIASPTGASGIVAH